MKNEGLGGGLANQVPFKNLKDFSQDKYSVVKIGGDDDSYVVKEGRTDWKDPKSPGSHPLNNHKRIIEDTQAIVDNFSEFLPKTQLVKGKNENNETVMYIVQEKVVGDRVSELDYSEDVAKQLNVFFDKVTDNYIRHLFYAPGETEPRSFYPDLTLRNFILGIITENPNTKLYYVDTYPVGGGTPSFVYNIVIPKLIARCPVEWKEFFEEYARKFKQRVEDFLSQEKEIPKQDATSLYRV